MKKESNGVWALMAIPLLTVLCCGLPVLLAGVGLTTLGAFFVGAKDWIIGGVVALLGVVFIVRSVRSKKTNCKDDCCTPRQTTERK